MVAPSVYDKQNKMLAGLIADAMRKDAPWSFQVIKIEDGVWGCLLLTEKAAHLFHPRDDLEYVKARATEAMDRAEAMVTA